MEFCAVLHVHTIGCTALCVHPPPACCHACARAAPAPVLAFCPPSRGPPRIRCTPDSAGAGVAGPCVHSLVYTQMPTSLQHSLARARRPSSARRRRPPGPPARRAARRSPPAAARSQTCPGTATSGGTHAARGGFTESRARASPGTHPKVGTMRRSTSCRRATATAASAALRGSRKLVSWEAQLAQLGEPDSSDQGREISP